jgi:hypothetical protein
MQRGVFLLSPDNLSIITYVYHIILNFILFHAASLDLDKLIQDGDPNPLEELITPILYCKAESEFDEDRVDPGFIKVFRVCQLLGEYLHHLARQNEEKSLLSLAKCRSLEEEKKGLQEEVGNLRESLTGAKKELKRRKEMLASTQIEVLGSNNHDEYDQVG